MVGHMQPIKIFISYAREDEKLLRGLEMHLMPLVRYGQISLWNAGQILPGSKREEEIHKHINEANIILILVSPDYLASDYYFNLEMERVLERQKSGEVFVIPIILRPASWKDTPLDALRALPRNDIPITRFPDRDQAFSEVVRGIAQVVENIQDQSASKVAWVDEGDRLMERKEYENALNAYEQALLQEPKNIRAYLGKGDVLRRLDRLEEALRTYEQAAALEPNNAGIWLLRGGVYSALGRFSEALTAYSRVLSLEPSNVEAHLGRGNVLFEQGQYEKALDAYVRVIQRQPAHASAHAGLAKALYHLEKYEDALSAYERAKSLEPTNAQIYFMGGNVLRRLKRDEEALEAYRRTTQLDPNYAYAYLYSGDIYLERGDYDEALNSYNQATFLDPANARAYHAKAQILRRMGYHDEATIAAVHALSQGYNVDEMEAIEVEASDPTLYNRVEWVQQFMKNAEFECRSIANEVGFLAIPKNSVWLRQFPRGLYVRVLFDSPLDSQAVRSIYHATRRHSDHALVVINKQPEISGWGEIHVMRGEPGNERFVCLPIDESVIQEGIARKKEQQELFVYINKWLGTGFDPYDVRDPVSSTVSFFGRQRVTEELLDGLRSGSRLGLFGIQKMGKSSVMQVLQRRAEFPVAYVYLRSEDRPSSIYKRILEDWSINGRLKYPNFSWKVPESLPNAGVEVSFDFNAAVRDLLRYLRTMVKTSPMLGVCLDEIENIIPAKVGNKEQMQAYVSFMDTLRGLQQETQSLAVLMAGVHPGVARQNYFWGNKKNPMYQVVTERFLLPLEREDCEYMILSLGKQINLNYEKKALEYIVEMSGGHPYLARQMCSVANKMRRDGSPISLEIIEDVVQEFVNNPQRSSYFDERGLWGELNEPGLWGKEVGEANHALLLALANAPTGLSQAELCACTARQAATKAFFALKERGLIYAPNNYTYQIAIGLFREWISAHQVCVPE